MIGALVLVRVLTEHLTPEQYGQLALVLTVAGMVNGSVMGVAATGIVRFYSIALEKQDLGGYMYDGRRLLFLFDFRDTGHRFAIDRRPVLAGPSGMDRSGDRYLSHGTVQRL